MNTLIETAKNGDKEAFTKLIILIKTDLYKIARMRFKCDDDINEAVQETIIEAFKSINKLRNIEYFKTWIIKILINNCNKIYKQNRKNNLVDYENVVEIDNRNNIENKINDLDFYILIDILNYEERIIITLYYLEEFTTKEISKILNKPEGTIKSKLSRAKVKIKKHIGGVNNE